MPSLEIAAAVAAVLGAGALGGRALPRGRRRLAAAVVFALGGAVLAGGLARGLVGPARADDAPASPGPGTTLGYVSSAACRACHPGEHASFARTYHRTMTQRATPSAVRAPLDGRPLLDGDRAVHLRRRGDEVWATLPDPDAVVAGRPAPDVDRRVVLTTGSHREQAFWVEGQRGDLRIVPFVWLVREARFVRRVDAFVTPPGEPLPPVRWGSSCIACHAVAGEPHHDLANDSFDLRAAELGVACEACHGPGARHVERYRDPVARYARRGAAGPDPTIIHPGKLPPERSAAVCGQCHAYAFPRDEAGWWQTGYARAFRAGDALAPSRVLLAPVMGDDAPSLEIPVDAIFWPDGGVRVGGREYNGLVGSACHAAGAGERKATCLSCHAMHRGDPAGQIAPERSGDAACTSCHAGTPEHSRHAAGSSGRACVSCHMPKTSFALLEAVRSHRIDRPRAARAPGGPPTACSLCHLDRSPAWLGRAFTSWYGGPAPDARDDWPVGLVLGLSGDAGVRALVADALGEGPAPASFRAALLAEMARDPYAAVRFVAERSRRGLAPAPPLDPAIVRELLAERDDRAITIAE